MPTTSRVASALTLALLAAGALTCAGCEGHRSTQAQSRSAPMAASPKVPIRINVLDWLDTDFEADAYQSPAKAVAQWNGISESAAVDSRDSNSQRSKWTVSRGKAGGVTIREGWATTVESRWIRVVPPRIGLGPRAGILDIVAQSTFNASTSTFVQRVYLYAGLPDGGAAPSLTVSVEGSGGASVTLNPGQFAQVGTDAGTGAMTLTVYDISTLSANETNMLQDVVQRAKNILP